MGLGRCDKSDEMSRAVVVDLAGTVCAGKSTSYTRHRWLGRDRVCGAPAGTSGRMQMTPRQVRIKRPTSSKLQAPTSILCIS